MRSKNIETEYHEVAVSHYDNATSVMIQSKAKMYDDYPINQASTRLTPEERDQVVAALLPEGSFVLSPEDVAGLLACEGYIPLNRQMIDAKMLNFSRIWGKIKRAKSSRDYNILYNQEWM